MNTKVDTLPKPVTHQKVGPAWSGVSCGTLIEIVDRACRDEPDKPVMIFEDGLVVTRQAFLDRGERFAAYVASRAKPGECVAIMLDNRAEFMIAFMGVIAARCMLVSINPTAKGHDAGHILRDSRAAMVIVGTANQGLIEGLRAECPTVREIVVVGDNEPDGLAAHGSDGKRLRFSEAGCRRDDVATIYYTSGTTGAPKGCMLHHGWWLRCCDLHIRMTRLEPGDRTLCCMPFYYADPAFQLLCSLHTGGTLVVMRRFSVSRFWKVVSENGVTDLLIIASMPILLLKAEPSEFERSHKVRVAVAVAVPPNLHRQLVERFRIPFLDNYGSTEATMNTRIPWEHADEMIGSGSMGVADPETELRIVDDHDQDLPVGQAGELIIRGFDFFVGYLDNPTAYAETMRGGWYHSGDLVRRDERGFYYFLGRKKDIIRRSGENIAAAEVEDVLRTHPKVLEAAVIPVPDEIRGEEVKAYILPTEGNSIATLPPEEIAAYCAERLAAYKVPRYIEYRTTDFPRTPSMRVQKQELKAVGNLTANAWDRERHAKPR